MFDLLQYLNSRNRISPLVLVFIFLVNLNIVCVAGMELGKQNKTDLLNIDTDSANLPVSEPNKTNLETEKVGVVATVNGVTITVMDILEVCGWQESQLPYIYKGSQLKSEAKKLRLQALEELINRKLIYQEFNRKGYTLPKKFVEENLDRLMKSFNIKSRREFKKKLKENGLTMQEFRVNAYENLAVDILINDKCYMDVFITPEHVYEYYKNNKSEFVSPGQIRLEVLRLNANGVHKDELNTLSLYLKKILKDKGSSEFADAVLLYSEGPNIENSGDIGWMQKSKLRKDFQEVIQEALCGDIVGPVKSKEGYYFIRVAEVRSEITKSFKIAKKGIKDRLTSEHQKKKYDIYIDSLRSKAYIQKYL